MRVLIADDQYEVRSALKILLEQEPEYIVAGEAADIGELMGQVKNTEPELVLLDWELGYARLNDVIQQLQLQHPGIRIIAMSCHPESSVKALNAGVDAFVSKGDHPEILLEAIKQIKKSRKD